MKESEDQEIETIGPERRDSNENKKLEDEDLSKSKRGRFETGSTNEVGAVNVQNNKNRSPIIHNSGRKRSLCKVKDDWFFLVDSNGH